VELLHVHVILIATDRKLKKLLQEVGWKLPDDYKVPAEPEIESTLPIAGYFLTAVGVDDRQVREWVLEMIGLVSKSKNASEFQSRLVLLHL